MKIIHIGALSMLAVLPVPALASDSAYSDVNLDTCKSISEPAQEDEGGAFVRMKCAGYKSYAMYFKEGDLRQSVQFGFIDKPLVEEGFESFGSFNFIGKKVEWRLDGSGRPVAAILRYFIENMNPETGAPDKAHQGQVLVVSRVGQPGDMQGCVAGYVDALSNPDPNLLARAVADDVAPSFTCGVDKAVFHGARGDRAGEPTSYLPETESDLK